MLALVTIIATLSSSFAPNFQRNASKWAARLRSDVLTRDDYDTDVPPASDRGAAASKFGSAHYSDAGTDVALSVRFFKVEDVRPAEASMRLKVWVRMSWHDERLAWEPEQYGGLNETYFIAGNDPGSETKQIWTPDIQPYNAVEGFVHTLEQVYAKVRHDGWVQWSRPGSLSVLCKFSGLVAFPFDNLICKIEVGGWMFSGGVQGLHLMGDGYDFSSQEVTSGASYQQVVITNVNAELRTYTYPCCPSEPWPIVIYTVTMAREPLAFLSMVLLPGVLITFLSFFVFLADTGSADALGYGIGVIVVNLLSNFILVGMLPICGELLWVDIFAMTNTTFCCISLLQSSVNIMLENLDDDTLLPLWLHVPLMETYRCLGCAVGTARSSLEHGVIGREHGISRVDVMPETPTPTQMTARKRRRDALGAATLIDESVAGVVFRKSFGSVSDPALSRIADTSSPQGDSGGGTPDSDHERARKLIFFESVFYQLDVDCSLFISEAECDLLLSYVALDLDPPARKAIFRKYDFVPDGGLNRVEFVALCTAVLWRVPTPLIEAAMANMLVARNAHRKRNATYWKRQAAMCDRYARSLIPTGYILTLIVLFNLDLSDYYADENHPSVDVMIRGLGPASISPTGTTYIAVYSGAVLAIGSAWAMLLRRAKRTGARLQEDLKEASRSSVEVRVANIVQQGTCAEFSIRRQGTLPVSFALPTAPAATSPPTEAPSPTTTEAPLPVSAAPPMATRLPPLRMHEKADVGCDDDAMGRAVARVRQPSCTRSGGAQPVLDLATLNRTS